MSSLPDSSFERERLLQALLVGEAHPDDPEVQALRAADADFSTEVEQMLLLRSQLDRAGGIEREVERIVQEELVGERAALEERFRERMESFLPAAMDADESGSELPVSAPRALDAEPQGRLLGRIWPATLAAAAAVLLTWWLGSERTSPEPDDPSPYENVLLGEGDLEPRLTLDPDGASGSLEWSPMTGPGRFIVRILEEDPTGERESRTLLEEQVRSASSLRLDPLPWNTEHDSLLIRVEYQIGGMSRPESTGELRLPASR